MANLEDHIKSHLFDLKTQIDSSNDLPGQRLVDISNHFSNSDEYILNLNESCALKDQRFELGIGVGIGACMLLTTLIWGLLFFSPDFRAISDALSTLCFLMILPPALLFILKSRGSLLLASTRPLSQSSKECEQLLALKMKSARVARYIDGVVLHRQLYHFDVLLGKYMELLDKEEEEQKQRLQICAALHNTQST